MRQRAVVDSEGDVWVERPRGSDEWHCDASCMPSSDLLELLFGPIVELVPEYGIEMTGWNDE